MFDTPEERYVAAALARSDFYTFTRLMFRARHGYNWMRAPHHKLICDYLTAVFDGHIKRLIINIPPRYSKTELAVVNFIAWCLGQYPDCEFIHTSYGSHLAENNSFAAREIVGHRAYREVFPNTRFDGRRSGADHWRTTAGGVVYAVGGTGTITGFGAGKVRPGFGGALIIDDPHKSDEARSKTKREGVIERYQNTLQSRLNDPKNTPIILIMQRLHEEDLAGWLLAGGSGEEWTHLNLPALLEDGTALWPEKHTAEHLEQMQRAMAYTFAGQYQQTPSPLAGGVIKPEMLQIVDAIPAGVKRWVRGYDFASSKDVGADYTAGGLLGLYDDDKLIIGHMLRDKYGPEELERAMVGTASQDPPRTLTSIPKDPGQASATQVKYLTGKLRGHRVIATPESGDKFQRAEPFAAQVNIGNVMMLRGDWNKALIEEMRLFPNGKHDDQIDALSRAFMEMVTKRVTFTRGRRAQAELPPIRPGGGRPIQPPRS